MRKQEFLTALLFLLHTDKRIQVCTLKQDEKEVWVHMEDKCPKCVALKTLKEEGYIQ